MDVYILYTCLCYMLRERKPVQGGVEELGGCWRLMGQRGGGWCGSRVLHRERGEEVWGGGC